MELRVLTACMLPNHDDLPTAGLFFKLIIVSLYLNIFIPEESIPGQYV